MKASILSLAFAGVVTAQVAVYGQCGGKGYTGSTTCVAGSTCVYSNEWYSQCQPGSASSSSKAATTTTKAATTTTSAKPTTSATTLKTTTSASKTSSSSTPVATGIQYLGRINPATKELTWPGTGLRFSYNGNAAINITKVTGSNSGQLIVDGTTSVIPTVTASIPLPSGKHSVEFRKRSEAQQGSIFLADSGTPATNRLIEFIGDSITVGYGLDGVLPCTNTAQVTDNPKTYAALAASALNADYNVVAWSGKGITRNYPGDTGPLISELWTRYGANDADNTYPFTIQPQVVVINIGTNDFAYLNSRDAINASTYQSAVNSFVNTVKTKYPKATVFLMSSPMLNDNYPTTADAQHTTEANALKNVAKAVGGYFVDWPAQGSDVGCDYHPNAATHAAEASVLANAISSVMGW